MNSMSVVMVKWKEIVINGRTWSDFYSRRDLYSSHIEEIIRLDNFFHHLVWLEWRICDEMDRSNASSIIIINGCTYGLTRTYTYISCKKKYHQRLIVDSINECWLSFFLRLILMCLLCALNSFVLFSCNDEDAICPMCYYHLLCIHKTRSSFSSGRQADWRRTIVYR